MGKKKLSALEVLSKAREKVKAGWTQGTWAEGSRVCAMGGIAYGLNGDANDLTGTSTSSAAKALQDEIKRKLGYVVAVETFNDDMSTKKKDVLSVFDSAIARLKKKAESDRRYRQNKYGN